MRNMPAQPIGESAHQAEMAIDAPPPPAMAVREQIEHDYVWRQLLGLACVSMPPGSWDKRFVKDTVTRGKPEAFTPKQRSQVQRLAYKYRRQLPVHLVPVRVQLPREIRRR